MCLPASIATSSALIDFGRRRTAESPCAGNDDVASAATAAATRFQWNGGSWPWRA
jgi:hypothetical protein